MGYHILWRELFYNGSSFPSFPSFHELGAGLYKLEVAP